MLNKKRWCLMAFLLAPLILAVVYLMFSPGADGEWLSFDKASQDFALAESPSQEGLANSPSVTPEICYQLYDMGQTPEELELDRRYWLMGFFRQLERDDYSDSASFQVADLVGLTPAEFKGLSFGDVSLSGGIHMSNHVVADNFMERPGIGEGQWSELELWLKERNFSAITSAVEERQLDVAAVYHGQSLLGRAIAEQPDLAVHEVEQLLAMGFSLDLDAVIMATRVGSSELAIYLAEHYQGDLAKSWTERQTPMNLSLAAIAGLREDLFYYFVNNGVTVFAFDHMLPTVNMLDVIPVPTSEGEREIATRMVAEVLNFDIRPMRASSVERLKSWLPATIQETYQEQLQPLVEPSSEVVEKADSLRRELAVFDEQIQMSTQVSEACESELDYDTEDYFTHLQERGEFVSSKLSLATKKQAENYLISAQNKFFNRLQSDPEFRAQLEAEGAVITMDERADELRERMRKITHFTLDEDWDSGYQYCSSLSEYSHRNSVCSELLRSYLWRGTVEWEYVEKLLPYVDHLNAYIAMSAVRSGRVDLLEMLVARGMEINVIDHRQQTLLADAIHLGGKTSVVKWLLEQGVAMKTEYPVMDVLDLALEELDRYQLFMFDLMLSDDSGAHSYTALEDIRLLIDFGATIERSHREKLRQLMFSNPEVYQRLVTHVPELAL